MATIEIEVFTFEQLSDDAKDRARQRYNQDCGYDNAEIELEHARETIKEVCGKLGVNLDAKHGLLYSVGDRGDYAGFNGSYNFVKLGASKVKREWPQDELLHKVCNAIIAVRAQCKGRELTATMQTRSGHMTVECWDCYGNEPEGRLNDFASDLEEALSDLAHWAYKTLLTAFEYTQSEEYVNDALTANDYQFDEHGNIVG